MSNRYSAIDSDDLLDRNDERRYQVHAILALAVLTLVIYVGSAWAPALQDDADAAHAQAAREIVERNDWTTLHINGIRYLEKAPLMYWMVAASYKIFGFTEFGTRFPLALGTLALVLAVYMFGRWMGGVRAGFYSGLAVCVGLGVYLFTRIMIPEVILSFWITVSFYAFLRAYFEEVDSPWYYVFYAGMAAAVMTKGLIGIVFPCGALALFVLVTGGITRIWSMRPVTGILLFLLLASPWHILAGLANEGGPNGHGFFWFYFVNEHFLRYLGKRYPVDYDTVPLFSFWALHLVWIFPFSVFLPLAARNLPEMVFSTRRSEQLRLFAWIWFLVVVGFFSFSTRQEYYTFPCFPALALLAGTGLAKGESEHSKWVLGGQTFLALLGVVIASVLGYFLWLSWGVPAASDISKVLTSNPENYRLALGHMSDLTVEAFAVLRNPALGAALTLGIGFSLAFGLRLLRKHLGATVATAITVAVFLYFAHSALGFFDPYLSSKQLAMAIRQQMKPGDVVVINGEYQGGSSIGFYLPEKVLLLNGRMTGLEFGSHYPDAPKVFLETPDFVTLWQSEKRVFLFTHDATFDALKAKLPREPVRVAAAGEKSVYCNRP